MNSSDAGHQQSWTWAIAPLILFLSVWVVFFGASVVPQGGPSGAKLGGDFAIFVSAASIVKDGGNPYDRERLYAAEVRFLRSEHLAAPKHESFIRVGSPPVVFWLLQPLVGLDFRTTGWVWVIAMYALLGFGFAYLLFALGWRRKLVPLVLFLAMPQTILAAYYGNLDGLVFASLVGALALVRRTPLLAGCLLGLAALKPQVGLPLAALIVLFVPERRRPAIAGLALGISMMVALSVLTVGPTAAGHWLGSLVGYSRELSVQPDIASLSGLYVYSVAGPLRIALQLATVLVALGITLLWWRRCRTTAGDRFAISAWLWMLWFLATPFAHFHDEVVLALPIVATLGIAKLRSPGIGLVPVYTLALSLLLFPVSRFHADAQCLALVLALAVMFLAAWREAEQMAPHGVGTPNLALAKAGG